MTRKDKLTIGLSSIALVLSCLSLFVSIAQRDKAYLYVYEGEYDLSRGFAAAMHIALVNSGDFDVLVSDLWLTVGEACSLHSERRIRPQKVSLLQAFKNRVAAAAFRFEDDRELELGKHSVCLYVESVATRGIAHEHIVGEDSLVVDRDGDQVLILNPNQNRWKKVLLRESEWVFRTPFGDA